MRSDKRFILLLVVTVLMGVAFGAPSVAQEEAPRGLVIDTIELDGTVLELGAAETEVEAAGVKSAVSLIDSAYSRVLPGMSFPVRVTLKGPSYSNSYCTTLDVGVTGGFSPALFPTRSVGTVYSGQTKTFEYMVKAPAGTATGTLTARTRWSSLSSCGGTALTSSRSQGLASAPGWTVSGIVSNPGCVLYDSKVNWTLTNSWRFSSVKPLSSISSRVAFLVPSQPATYTFSAQWNCLFVTQSLPRTKTLSIYVTGNSAFTF